ncbi:MAG: hypothetical protein K1X94_14120 [Sandaracinaceae bacterium]|nr:hypothetical protein [Sandaracinaceae bacterium]
MSSPSSRTTARFRILALLALVLAVVGLPSVSASAQRVASSTARAPARQSVRVIIERFRGTRASTARNLLISNLSESGYTVIPDSEVDAVRRRLHLPTRMSGDDYVALARELNAAAIVDGRVARARRAWNLTVRVRNGLDGSILGSASWGGRSTSAIDGVGRSGAERLGEHLMAARAPASEAQQSSEPQWYQAGYHDDTESPIDDEDPTPEPEPTDTERYDTGHIMISGGTLWRSFGTVLDVYAGQHGGGDPSAIIGQERGYASAGIGHFELGGEGDIYPGAFGDQPFPYLGLVASFRNSVGLSSTAPASDPVDGDVSLPTNQMDLRVGLRGRYRFGPRRGDFLLFLDAGFVMSTFTFGVDQLAQIQRDTIVPPMEYQSIDLGLGFDFAIVRDALSLAAYGRGRIGVGIGVQTRNVWGIETSPANGFLFGLELRHDATWLARGAFASLRFEYFQYITQFRGQVGCYDTCPVVANPWDDRSLWEVWPVADPTDPSSRVTGGPQDPVADHSVRWGLYLGYAFD